jgi:EmrB/QacA subfamily drug resistance transporter
VSELVVSEPAAPPEQPAAAGPERFGRVTALVGAPLLIGPVLGPMIGGLIVDSASWRWMFTVNVPMTVLALGLALRLPEGGPRSDPGRLDWLGAALLSPGLAAVVLGLARAQSLGTPADPTAFVPLLVGAGLLAWFVRHALPAARPLIDIRLLRSRSVAAAAAVVFLGNGAFFAAWLILPLYLQLARGQSPLDTGLLMAPQGLGVALAMPFAGRLTDRFGGGRVALFGVVAGVFANLPFIWLAADTSFVLLATALVLRGIAFGAMLMPAMAAAYAVLRPAEIPAATSVLTVAQRIGGSAAAALATAVIGRELAAAPGTPSADPFGSAFAWIAAMLALATIPAVLLALERAPRRGERQPPETFAVDSW